MKVAAPPQPQLLQVSAGDDPGEALAVDGQRAEYADTRATHRCSVRPSSGPVNGIDNELIPRRQPPDIAPRDNRDEATQEPIRKGKGEGTVMKRKGRHLATGCVARARHELLPAGELTR
jgi:hypothetical protein